MSDPLWQRWEAFLGKIGDRQHEILGEADAGLLEIIDRFPEDPMPMTNALEGVRHRLDELHSRVNDTWDDQVQMQFEAVNEDLELRALDRKDDFLLELEEQAELFAARMRYTFYRKLQPRAEASARRAVPCAQCGAPLQLPTRTRTVSHTCESCGAVNQVMADGAVAQSRGIGRATAELECIPLRYQIHRFRNQVHRERRASRWAAEPVSSMEHWLEMERCYWEKLVKITGDVLGEPPDTALATSRIQHFIQHHLETDQRWRLAKGLSR
ncbi:MAG: hypothetical protein AB7P03_07255 [Kofleriaceae bacterium]